MKNYKLRRANKLTRFFISCRGKWSRYWSRMWTERSKWRYWTLWPYWRQWIFYGRNLKITTWKNIIKIFPGRKRCSRNITDERSAYNKLFGNDIIENIPLKILDISKEYFTTLQLFELIFTVSQKFAKAIIVWANKWQLMKYSYEV